MKQTNREGFTLAELLIVVAIIAVLVAIAIPVFTAQKHKAEVAVDQANLRAYYAEIQSDYITTGEKNSKVPLWDGHTAYDYYTIVFLNGDKVKLNYGTYVVNFDSSVGYQIKYFCTDSKYDKVIG